MAEEGHGHGAPDTAHHPPNFEDIRAELNHQPPDYLGTQIRYALGGDAFNADTAVATITDHDLDPDPAKETVRLAMLNKATLQAAEQKHQGDTRPGPEQWAEWKNTWVTYFGQFSNFFQADAEGQVQAALLNRVGIDIAHFDAAKMDTFVTEYFPQRDGKSHRDIKKFVDKVMHLNNDEITKILPALKIVSAMFGEASKNLNDGIIQEVRLRMKQRDPAEKQRLVNEAASANGLSDDEKNIFGQLWAARATTTDTHHDTTHTTPPHTPDVSHAPPVNPKDRLENQRYPDGDYTLGSIFFQVREDGDSAKYMVENPPPINNPYSIPEATLGTMASDERFYEEISHGSENKLVPRAAATPAPNHEGDERFDSTKNQFEENAGLLALAAISSLTPEKQARLFATIANNILRFHERNGTNLDDLNEWLNIQIDHDVMHESRSTGRKNIAIFMENEHQDDEPSEPLRPPEQRLFPWNASETDIDLGRLNELWQPRITELRQALTQNKFKRHHLRWLEFLSHSIKMDSLLTYIKTHQYEFRA